MPPEELFMTTLNAKELSLNDVHRLLGFQRQYNSSFTSLLSLELLTEFELQELLQIRDDFLCISSKAIPRFIS
jgi:hypothetical protein